jgi:hypothetical protein
MNSKLCKSLRKQSGGNSATYAEQGSPRIYQTVNGFTFLAAKGVSRKLDKLCSRYTYQQLKKSI